MASREEFNRNKRWAGLFSAFLIVHLTAGVQQSNGGGLFGITLENPGALDEVFLLFSLIFTFKSINLWTAMDDVYRRSIQYKIDDGSSLIFSIVTFSFYVSQYLQNFVIFEFSVPDYLDFSFSALLISALFLVLISSIYTLRSFRKEQSLLKDSHIVQLLITGTWYLIFANARARISSGAIGWKKISFKEDGFIGEGRNKNENTWQVIGGYVEIFNDKDELYSRFILSDKEFEATDDSDVQALPGQRIVRNIDEWKTRKS